MSQDPLKINELVFLLGSFQEQMDALTARVWSEEELKLIWPQLTKNPQGRDASSRWGYQVHLLLLKQPFLPPEILTELELIYQQSETAMGSLKKEIIQHGNYPVEKFRQFFAKSLSGENWGEIEWLVQTHSILGQKLIIQELSKDWVMEKIKVFRYNNQTSADKILKILVANSPNKSVNKSFYFYLQREKMLTLDWFEVFLKNPILSPVVLRNMVNQVAKFPELLTMQLLLHPALAEIDRDSLLTSLRGKKSAVILAGIIDLLTTKQLSAQALEGLFVEYRGYEIVVKQLVQQNNFNNQWIWHLFLNTNSFQTLPSKVQEILKKMLKIY